MDLNNLKTYGELIGKIETIAKEKIMQGYGGQIAEEYLRRKAENEMKKNSPTASAQEIAESDFATQQYLHDTGMKDYITGVINGSINDATLIALLSELQHYGQVLGIELGKTGNELHRQRGVIVGQIMEQEVQASYNQSQETKEDITLKTYSQLIGKIETIAKEKIMQGYGGQIAEEYLRRKAENEMKKNSPTASAQEIAESDFATQQYLHDTGMKDYITGVINGSINDATLIALLSELQHYGQVLGIELGKTGNELHRQRGVIVGQIMEQEAQASYNEEQESNIRRR